MKARERESARAREEEYPDTTRCRRLALQVCRTVPGGVLVFFPSYGALDTCLEHWKQTRGGGGGGGSHWRAIEAHKTIVVEPRGLGANARMGEAGDRAIDRSIDRSRRGISGISGRRVKRRERAPGVGVFFFATKSGT